MAPSWSRKDTWLILSASSFVILLIGLIFLFQGGTQTTTGAIMTPVGAVLLIYPLYQLIGYRSYHHERHYFFMDAD